MTNIEYTQRGFAYQNFKDANGVICLIQKSSACQDEGLIWFGAKDIGLQRFTPETKWQKVELSQTETDHHVANNKMHLTQSQVRELLPVLTLFAETGNLE